MTESIRAPAPLWTNETSLGAALWSVKADALWALVFLTLAFEVGPVQWAVDAAFGWAFGEVGEIPEGTEMGALYWALTGVIAAFGLYHAWKAVAGFLGRLGARQEVNVANVENHGPHGSFRVPVAFVTRIEKSWAPFGPTIRIFSKGATAPHLIHGARKADAGIAAIKKLNGLI